MKFLKTRWLLIACLLSLVLLTVMTVACSKKAQRKPPKEAEELMKRTEELKVKHQQKVQELKEMSIPQVISELEIESTKQIEPFNSMAYQELVSRGTQVAPEVKKLITKEERTSLLSLLALREMDHGVYSEVDTQVRIKILIGSLQSTNYFNIWGIPHLYWEPAAEAIIEHGGTAIAALKPLLKDKRPAPVWGSEEVIESQRYQYRICDYAMALINAITERKTETSTDPEARDQMIDGMMSDLQ